MNERNVKTVKLTALVVLVLSFLFNLRFNIAPPHTPLGSSQLPLTP